MQIRSQNTNKTYDHLNDFYLYFMLFILQVKDISSVGGTHRRKVLKTTGYQLETTAENVVWIWYPWKPVQKTNGSRNV